METLSEGQKQNNPYTKNGDFSKQGEKNLYTQIIEVLEQESKEKIKDEKALEIIGRKFLESFKDKRIHQNLFGSKEDFINLGRVIANKEKIMINNDLAQLIARKYLWNSAPNLIPALKKEEIQTMAILSQSDHDTHYLDKNRGFDEFGDKKFYIELPIGGLFKGKQREVHSPDGVFINFANNKIEFYFVELKSDSVYSSGNSLTQGGKYLKIFLGNNAISGLNRIGVTNSNKEQVERFKKNEKISKNSKLLTTSEFSKFIQGAIFIRDVNAKNIESLENNNTLKKMFELLHSINKKQEFKENIKDFKKYIETLNSSWVNDTEKSVKTKYFNY